MSNLISRSPPRGMFEGKNIMTPSILGYYKVFVGWAELSSGRGICDQPIWGVTVRPDPYHKRSQLFQSERAARDYIEELQEDLLR